MTNKTTLNVDGMTCSNCSAGIRKYLQNQGLEQVDVDFSSGEVIFKSPDQLLLSDVIKGIEKLGYKVRDEKSADISASKYSPVEKKFILSLIFSLPLLAHMISPWPILHNAWFQLVLCIPVMIIGMGHFGKSAIASLRIGIPNMDVLISIGSMAAFIYSLVGTLLYGNEHGAGHYLFYETAATIITLVLLGNVLEQRSVKKTRSALEELNKLRPETSRLVTIGEDGSELIEEISTSLIKPGDTLLFNDGDKLAADGKLIYGNALVDESMMTGESIPVNKNEGDSLTGGSIVLEGNLKMLVQKSGDDTVLANIITMVKEAQRAKPEIQKLGDKVSSYFVPAVIGISLITFFAAYFIFDLGFAKAMMNSIAVLVVSCPCAMGLATPTAVMVGIGRAAKNGILIKSGNVLEVYSGVKTMVFDKTGTLTTGKFKIEKLEVFNNDELFIKRLIRQMEQHSSHPIAKSLLVELSSFKEKAVKFNSLNEIKGLGVEGTTAENVTYFFGKNDQKDHDFDLILKKGDTIIAGLNIKDELKSGIKEMMQELRSRKIKTILLSGDSLKKTESIATELGFDSFKGGMLPHEKLEEITKYSSENITAMVGDGINDAPALSRANIGISLGGATQVAIKSADIVLMKSENLETILQSLAISKHTLMTIKQNLFWAFLYNVVAIPIAAFGFLNPMIAAFSMAFSDVVVIGNSLRLKIKKLN